MSYNSPTIQNGRLRKAHRRNAFFSGWSYRVSELVQHPKRVTLRELCFSVWLIHALIRGVYCLSSIQDLLGHVDVNHLCGVGNSFYGCSQIVAWDVVYIVWRWTAEIVPWAIFCSVMAFLGEVVLNLR